MVSNVFGRSSNTLTVESGGPHIDHVAKKIASESYAIQKYLSVRNLKSLYYSFVHSYSFIDSPEYDSGVMSCGDRESPTVWCRERTQIRNALDCQYVNYVSCGPVGRGCAKSADGCTAHSGLCCLDRCVLLRMI